MGTCCGAHLETKIRDYAKNAQNGAVTVTVIKNPPIGTCDYCTAPAEFACSYYSKQ